MKFCIDCIAHSEQLDLFGDEFTELSCTNSYVNKILDNTMHDKILTCNEARLACRGMYFVPKENRK